MTIAAFITLLLTSESAKKRTDAVPLSAACLATTAEGTSEITLPHRLVLENATNSVLLTLTPEAYLYDDGIATFSTANLAVKVTADSRLIYSYGSTTDTQRDEYGMKQHIIRLDHRYNNSQLQITLFSTHAKTVFEINEISYTTENALMALAARSSVLSVLIAVFMLSIGISLTFLVIIALRKSTFCRDYIWFILFCLMEFIWILSGSEVVRLFVGAPKLMMKIRAVSLFGMSITILIHIANACKHTSRTVKIGILSSTILYGCTVLMLATFRVFSFSLVPLLMHPINLLVVAATLASLVHAFKAEHPHRIMFAVVASVGFVLLMTQMLLNALTVYDQSYILEIVLTLSLVPIFSSVSAFVRSAQEAVLRERVLETIAFSDSLTGLYNRNMFATDTNELQFSDNLVGSYLAVFDVNELKKTNDTLGHAAGDRLIHDAATIISRSFSSVGKAYRIGGDEFAVIILPQHGKNIKPMIADCIKNYTDRINDYNAAAVEFPLNIAYSIDSFNASTDRNISDLFKRVDDRMYIEKNNMKQREQRGYHSQVGDDPLFTM